MKLNNKNKRVFVAMSGGVDSSVTAALLKKRGYDITGVYMRCYNPDGCSEYDIKDAQKAADILGIPFYVLDFEKEYKKKVVDYMISGYKKGITPNPDVMCNKEIKFGIFLDRALKMGADYIATGHYVRLAVSSQRSAYRGRNRTLNAKRYTLYAALDAQKDQSYFLWALTQKQLQYCLFPIGDYLKSEVRGLAKKFDLPNADKKDSQGICFIGEIKIGDFLSEYIKPKRGFVLNEKGDIVGEHKGAWFYTIGQRHGFDLRKSEKGKVKRPCYIAEKDVETNTLLVVEGNNHPLLFKKEAKLKKVNFINPTIGLISARGGQARLPALGGNGRIRVLARVRYRQPLFGAILKLMNLESYKLEFDLPIKFIAPGQSVVFYECSPLTDSGLKLLGGGVIVDL